MKLHEIMPQAMLFVRGINAGISLTIRSKASRRTTRTSRCGHSNISSMILQ
jgi:hypothetical protein